MKILGKRLNIQVDSKSNVSPLLEMIAKLRTYSILKQASRCFNQSLSKIINPEIPLELNLQQFPKEWSANIQAPV